MQRKILIVDDSALNRLLLKNTLGNDYEVSEAENGRDALEFIEKNCKMLSAVLLDIIMPEMNGYEVVYEIKKNPVFSKIPVIIVTGSDDEESMVKALSYGANDLIFKPFNTEIVKQCLKKNIALCETL